ncbi:LysR substrate-binding domain-containing protein [Paraburkholderia sediminicola]|uniref:LysR substrate-binding domain-containing protein n=1 Tax=Paraburkholderia sediminicola TaxID=458836 RepID=UPI0038BC7E15
MKLHQLRSFNAIVRHDFSVTRAAEHLHASQPGLTKHIQLLEAELGVSLFMRHKRRLLGLTSAGKAILPIAAQAIIVLENLQRTARQFSDHRSEILTVATSPTPARIFFPALIQQFAQRKPDTRVHVISGSVSQSIDAVSCGKADFCLCSAPRVPVGDIAFFPCYEHRWLLVAPLGHELLKRPRLSLEDIARYPLITYKEGYASRAIIAETFAQRGLSPDIVLDTSDGDIMRHYVSSGLGIAIVGGSALEAKQDTELASIDLGELVPTVRMHIGIRRNAVPSTNALNFFDLFAPDLVRELTSSNLLIENDINHAA